SRFIKLILLAANHRAGSTLLQRICNSRKKTLIWGEHNAALRNFASIYVDACQYCVTAGDERESYFSQGEDSNLWIASMNPEVEYLQRAVINSARVFLRTFYGQYQKNHDILGFKEVRYGYNELALLRRCYPEAQILLLIRNPINTWKSTPRAWYASLDDWINKWNSLVKCFRSFASNDSRCHLLRYEDLIQKDAETMEIVGDAAKISLHQIEMVLANKVGGRKGEIDESDRKKIGERCREAMEALGYI
ncbi:MAG: sulfotransferase, partial [Planctomycetes bacterium]|nr:sulfotransferase [Planctomycetota bacterium]